VPPTTTSTTVPPTTTSTTVPATTTTVPAGSGGLINNPSVEIVDPANSALPQSWAQSRWGTNTTSFTWVTGGAHTGNRFTRIAMTAYTNGDAKWIFPYTPVTPSTSYTFTNWYKSTVATQLVVEVRTAAGVTSWIWLKTLPAATAWTQNTATFTTPANAANLTILHLIAGVGTLDTDDASLTGPGGTTTTTTAPTTTSTTVPPTTTTSTTVASTTAPPNNRATVYLTFDDGPTTGVTEQFMTVLEQYGIKGVFFLVGDRIDSSSQATAAAITTRGFTVGNHSNTHADLTTLTSAGVRSEISLGQAAITAATGQRPGCMRPPYGYINSRPARSSDPTGMPSRIRRASWSPSIRRVSSSSVSPAASVDSPAFDRGDVALGSAQVPPPATVVVAVRRGCRSRGSCPAASRGCCAGTRARAWPSC
jgi:hypothetical protein